MVTVVVSLRKRVGIIHRRASLAQDGSPQLVFSVQTNRYERQVITVKTVATQIQPPESTEIKSIYVAFQTVAHKRALSVACDD